MNLGHSRFIVHSTGHWTDEISNNIGCLNAVFDWHAFEQKIGFKEGP
jgi:hypothetical protein